MKRVFYLFILLLLVGCNIFKSDDIKFSLEVKNEKINRLALKQIIGKEYILIDSIFRKQWTNNKEFKLFKPGIYFLQLDKKSGVPLYLEAGFNLQICISKRTRFSFKGKGRHENEYLLRNKYHSVKHNYSGYRLKPAEFNKALDQSFSPYFKMIGSKYKRSDFWASAYHEQHLRKLTAQLNYPQKYESLNKKSLKLPTAYWDFLSDIDINSEAMYQTDSDIVDKFLEAYTSAYLFRKSKDKLEGNSEEILNRFKLIEKTFNIPEIKNKALDLYAKKVMSNYEVEDFEEGIKYYLSIYSDKDMGSQVN